MTGGDREAASAMLHEVRSLSRPVLAQRIAAARAARRKDLLGYLSAPVLAIAGSSDRLLSPRTINAIMNEVRLGVVAEIDAPHLAVQVAPAEVWAAINEEFETAA
jgi:hypothetical protein